MMKDETTSTENLFERLTSFGTAYIELLKLKTIERTTEVISTTVPDLIFSLLVMTFLIFGNFGLALWLGEVLGKVYFGFLAVAGFYLLLGIITRFLMRSWLKKNAENYLIRQIFRNDET